jgi:glycosyltransferase involved in cell wall biosynthesis
MTRILFDLSDFLSVPLRTGIQRVCYEIIRSWPKSSELAPASIDRWGRLFVLPRSVLDLIVEFFQTPVDALQPIRRKIQRCAHLGTPVQIPSIPGYDGLLLGSLFWEPGRVEFYLNAGKNGLARRIFAFVHDMLPWLHPELFIPGFGSGMMNYIWGLKGLPNRAYNSEQTRDLAVKRVLCDDLPPGPVLPLGAESLGRAEPKFNPSSRRFSVIGTLEPRKNHRVVMDAFNRLWSEGVEADLTFAGIKGWLGQDDHQLLKHLLRTQPRFQWFGSLGDEEMANLIRSSRATIYPALMEGYGLPPLESLALGVPVIVSGGIPSVAMVKPFGQIRMAESDVESVVRGVRLMLDDSFAREKTQEISNLQLPCWDDIGPKLEAWILASIQTPSQSLRKAA